MNCKETLATGKSVMPSGIKAGLELHKCGNYRQAARSYRRCLRGGRESVLGHYLLGLALMAAGQVTQARAEWSMASGMSDVSPQDAWARSEARTLLSRV
jgi:Flp pilus assembly protein TadD